MFQALYRKYRPKTFKDVVGQNHIVSVLGNAIEKNQISHAYLFYGPRGTGKTSIAKIFANEVNENKEYQKDNVDIIEIDAASNNGVDEVRDIKEAIKFLPTEGKYKVYIIDEVHMLTTAAFNALLKTLEEPPQHVIFILATTEIHKIPATILSRCQRFEFKNLSTAQLKERLEYIAQAENINIESKAVEKIATLAKGGLRDAISILDQISNYDDKITLENILEVTSSISEDRLLDFYENLLLGDVSAALVKYSDFVAEAKDTKLLLNDLINITRDAVVYKNLKNSNQIEYNIEKIEKVVLETPFDSFYKIIEKLSETEQYIRFSTEYMSYMQICIVKICSEDNVEVTAAHGDVSKITRLENKINDLEKKLSALATGNVGVSSPAQREPQRNIRRNIEPTATGQLNISYEEANISENFGNELINAENNIANSNEVLPQDTIIDSKQVIIKDRLKIKALLTESTDVLTNYASKVFERIIRETSSDNNAEFKNMQQLFKSCNLVASSKEAGVLVFYGEENIAKMTPSSKYKKYLEQLFKNIIGVKYSIYTLQDNQYEVLKEEISKGEIEVSPEKIVEENAEPTIENLFSEIIVEN